LERQHASRPKLAEVARQQNLFTMGIDL